MKKRTAAFVLALLMLLPLALSGCGQTAEEPGAELSGELAGVDMEPVQWSFACHAGSTSSYYLMECDFADAVRERTNGLVDITVYASGELPYQGTEFARCVSDGTLEMAAAPFSYISGECPACGVVGWPLLAGEVDELAVAVEAADIALMSDDISKIPYLKRLSNATVKTIKLSITLSMCINFAAIVLSLLEMLNPVTGALVHNAGSCFVVLIAALLYDRKFE